MQNFVIENKFLCEKNKNQIKKLWLENFLEDDEKTVDCFLENVFENEKGVGAFLNDDLIAMVLFLNSKIISKNKIIKAVYFYAVCTSEEYRKKGVMRKLFSFATKELKNKGYELCFLVPENKELFGMYEKLSFKRTLAYQESVFCREKLDGKNTAISATDFCYNDYLKFRKTSAIKTPVIIWNEKEFNFIFNKDRSDVSFLFNENGYAIYEKCSDEILVWEFCGEKHETLNLIFSFEKNASKIKVREPVKNQRIDFGLSLALTNSSKEFENIYFGLPFG